MFKIKRFFGWLYFKLTNKTCRWNPHADVEDLQKQILKMLSDPCCLYVSGIKTEIYNHYWENINNKITCKKCNKRLKIVLGKD